MWTMAAPTGAQGYLGRYTKGSRAEREKVT